MKRFTVCTMKFKYHFPQFKKVTSTERPQFTLERLVTAFPFQGFGKGIKALALTNLQGKQQEVWRQSLLCGTSSNLFVDRQETLLHALSQPPIWQRLSPQLKTFLRKARTITYEFFSERNDSLQPLALSYRWRLFYTRQLLRHPHFSLKNQLCFPLYSASKEVA